jgi:flagellar motility protein MotE (MotC chaperone)
MIAQLTADAEAIAQSIAAGMEAESYKALEGQEKYKADQERKDAEKLADGKRKYAKQLEGEIEEHMKTVEYFRKIATSHRNLANSVHRLK